jgi:hypothetical protein
MRADSIGKPQQLRINTLIQLVVADTSDIGSGKRLIAAIAGREPQMYFLPVPNEDAY